MLDGFKSFSWGQMKKQLLPTCSIRNEKNPSLTLLGAQALHLSFLNLLCRSLGEDFAL